MDFSGAFSPDNLTFLMEGFYVTLKVALISIILSFIIGGAIGTLRFAKIPVLSKVLAVCCRINTKLAASSYYIIYLFCTSRIGY